MHILHVLMLLLVLLVDGHSGSFGMEKIDITELLLELIRVHWRILVTVVLMLVGAQGLYEFLYCRPCEFCDWSGLRGKRSKNPDATKAPEGPPYLPSPFGAAFHGDVDHLFSSQPTPVSVHRLRPGDVGAVGVMGASFGYGYGSEEEKLIGYGSCFASGSDYEPHQQVTLYNLFRHFNRGIKGGSVGNIAFGNINGEDGFNVSLGGSKSTDMLSQAKKLEKRMRAAMEDFDALWKLVFIHVGLSDLGCLDNFNVGSTHEFPTSVEAFAKGIERAVAFIQKRFPKTLVVIVPLSGSELFVDAKTLLKNEGRNGDAVKLMKRDIQIAGYNEAFDKICENPKYQKTDDFAVIQLPFWKDIHDAYRNEAGEYDRSFYYKDMFHMSCWGNGIVSVRMWNSLFEPVGNKKTFVELNEHARTRLTIPPKQIPFIRTHGNDDFPSIS